MPPDAKALLQASGIDAGYGTMQVLWEVDLDVRPGETVLLLCAGASWRQLAVWQDSIALWENTLAHTEKNYLAHYSLALALEEHGNYLDEAIAEYRLAAGLAPNDAVAHANLGYALFRKKEYAEAATAFRQAVTHLTVLCAPDPQTAGRRKALSKAFQQLGWLLQELGRPEELAAVARKRRALWPRDPNECCIAAAEYAHGIPRVGKGKKELSVDEQAERERHAAAALDALSAAVRQGFHDRKLLETAPSFEPLRVAVRPLIFGGVLSIVNGSLSRLVVSASAGGLPGASDAVTRRR